MMMRDLMTKAKRRIRGEWVRRLRQHPVYPWLYPSQWHGRYGNPGATKNPPNFLTAIPHPGAGIGHQLANWIAGYWFAKEFGLRFAHWPFASEAWDRFLGMGEGEPRVAEVVGQGYRKRYFPLFDETNPDEVANIRRIIASYADSKVVFVMEQDQFYAAQHGVAADLQRKFHTSPQRGSDKLAYDPNAFNIAVHVRRGDVSLEAAATNPNLALRWQSESYFETALEEALDVVGPDREPHIYLFSQGEAEDFASFARFPNLRLCLDMDARASFLHMCFADLLITSKSSFSYKPALLSRGIKIVPGAFWHGYPSSSDWILADDLGKFDRRELGSAIDSAKPTG